jgi:rhodanese-related sulfurtransferase
VKTIIAVVVLLALFAGGAYLLSTGGVTPPGADAQVVSGPQAPVLPNIKPEEAYRRWKADPVQTVLLDVRTPEEYGKWNIPGAVHVPVADKNFGALVADKIPDKNTNIFLFCRTGRRTIPAGEALRLLGYGNLYNLGGIIDWPYETAGSDK